MTSGVFFTCRTKPFDRGLRAEQLTETIRESWRHAPQNHRPGVVPAHVFSEVFFPRDRKHFFENVVSVFDWKNVPLSPRTVFVTTGQWGWTDKLVGQERRFFERFVEVVRGKDPYATVGVARLLLARSVDPPPLTFIEETTIDSLFAHASLPDNVLLETRLHPDSQT
ncbi:MAG: hypothetical protein AB8H86_03675 [Polyangiales bacterium]